MGIENSNKMAKQVCSNFHKDIITVMKQINAKLPIDDLFEFSENGGLHRFSDHSEYTFVKNYCYKINIRFDYEESSQEYYFVSEIDDEFDDEFDESLISILTVKRNTPLGSLYLEYFERNWFGFVVKKDRTIFNFGGFVITLMDNGRDYVANCIKKCEGDIHLIKSRWKVLKNSGKRVNKRLSHLTLRPCVLGIEQGGETSLLLIPAVHCVLSSLDWL